MTRLFPRREPIAHSQKLIFDFRTILLLCALSVAGCASLPSLEKVRTVSLRTDFPSSGRLAVDVYGNPNTRPGRMAGVGFALTEGCGIAFFVCAAVTVPLGAALGAVITAASTLPERTAYRLNIVTASVMAGLNLDASFEKAMREEASRQGIVLTHGYADARISVVVTRFQWDVGVGNSVAIRIDFEVTGFADGKRGHRNITYISERAKVSEWIADSGKRIRQGLMMDEASQTIWQKVLDRD